MATYSFTASPSIPAINMVLSGPTVPDFLNNYNRISSSPNQITLSEDLSVNNRTIFTGSNLSFGTSNGKATFTSGTINEITFRIDGTNVVQVTGLNISAVDFGNQLSPGTDIWAYLLSGDDTVNGAGGNDTLSGYDGNDIVNGLSGDDRLNGEVGNDVLNGGLGNDVLSGGSGNDILNGGDGNDRFFGGTGDDVMTGNDGTDTFTGGSGADDFRFVVGDDQMIITDFEAGIDDLFLVGLSPGFTIQDLIPFVSQDGNDVLIASGDQSVRFENVQLSELSAGDVVFV